MYGYQICPDCGIAVQRVQLKSGAHECAPERYANYQTTLWRRELEGLETEMEEHLKTPIGRFEQFIARRQEAA